MPSRYFAFLRAINVGGHTVKMDRLRRLFEAQGFAGVETFLASGNVVFEAPAQDTTELAGRIERRLREALGYEVATFIRTAGELAAIAGYRAFPPAAIDGATAFNVALLAAALDDEATHKVLALKTAIDEFHVHGREVYWLCQKLQSQSTFSNAVLERTLGRRSTLRQVRTIKQMAAKYSPGIGDS